MISTTYNYQVAMAFLSSSSNVNGVFEEKKLSVILFLKQWYQYNRYKEQGSYDERYHEQGVLNQQQLFASMKH